jgi:hypothetical protein
MAVRGYVTETGTAWIDWEDANLPATELPGTEP